jgi:hypothetical protein
MEPEGSLTCSQKIETHRSKTNQTAKNLNICICISLNIQQTENL